MLKTDETVFASCSITHNALVHLRNTIHHPFLRFCMKLNIQPAQPAQLSRVSGAGLPSVELLLPRSAELQNQIEGSRQDIVLPHK